MRVFLTGGTGYIGGAVAQALLKRGHEVAALARAESDDSQLRSHGAFIVAGDLSSLPQLAATLGAYDALVHTAFSGTDPVEQDRIVVDTLSKQKGHFVYTSGVWVLGNGDNLNESTPVNPLPLVAWRPAHEKLALANGGGAVIRPGCVYGGKQSLLADWFAAADQKRPIKVVGDGKNRWAMVDLHDLADCYVRAVEQRATGVFHAVDDAHATIDECAGAIAKNIEHVPAEGFMAPALTVNQIVSSKATRARLGWSPRRTFVNSIGEQWREWRTATRG
ncbi:MAG TPA: NAD-dependent epimerase/dehydratase family protein [Thermoanaerobaculia bacterium]|nr:NAD-dependent epimerase/dehydratase family protein [Thermoanaerobaculia bacterium]